MQCSPCTSTVTVLLSTASYPSTDALQKYIPESFVAGFGILKILLVVYSLIFSDLYDKLSSIELLWNQVIVGAGKPVAIQFSVMVPSKLVTFWSLGCSVTTGETIGQERV